MFTETTSLLGLVTDGNEGECTTYVCTGLVRKRLTTEEEISSLSTEGDWFVGMCRELGPLQIQRLALYEVTLELQGLDKSFNDK